MNQNRKVTGNSEITEKKVFCLLYCEYKHKKWQCLSVLSSMQQIHYEITQKLYILSKSCWHDLQNLCKDLIGKELSQEFNDGWNPVDIGCVFFPSFC